MPKKTPPGYPRNWRSCILSFNRTILNWLFSRYSQGLACNLVPRPSYTNIHYSHSKNKPSIFTRNTHCRITPNTHQKFSHHTRKFPPTHPYPSATHFPPPPPNKRRPITRRFYILRQTQISPIMIIPRGRRYSRAGKTEIEIQRAAACITTSLGCRRRRHRRRRRRPRWRLRAGHAARDEA